MFFYAQLDEKNICIARSQLSGEVNLPNMILIDEEAIVLGKKYNNGIWEDVPKEPEIPEPPQPNNQDIAKMISDLEFQLIMNGVI